MNMTNKLADRIMEGARTPEGKVIAILLVLCLAFMCWNVGSLRAFGDAYDQVNASANADKAATAQEQSAAPAPEQPAATEEAPAAVEQPDDLAGDGAARLLERVVASGGGHLHLFAEVAENP